MQIKSKNKGSEYMKWEKCSKCESCEKSTHRTEEEKKSLTKQYFSFLEQLKYGFRHKITLPAIRKRILQNKAVVRSYRKIISRIYGNWGKRMSIVIINQGWTDNLGDVAIGNVLEKIWRNLILSYSHMHQLQQKSQEVQF